MVKKGLYLSLITVLLIGIAGFAGCRRHSPENKAEFMVDYVAETLDLNDDQREHLDQIKDEMLDKAIEMRADKKTMYLELVAQLRSEQIDQERLKAMAADHRIKMETLIDLGIKRLAEFHATLSAEQREKAVDKLESFKKWHGHGWE